MMPARVVFAWMVLALIDGAPSAAQSHDHSPRHAPPTAAASPYAPLAGRAVKAFSDEQVADLKAGRGMGLALAAELNNYPGPLHVLELADGLQLSAGQRARTQELMAAMKAESIALGERIIAAETALDRQFAGRVVTRDSLAAATAQIGRLQGELRATHLRYHLDMAAILSSAQIGRYAELRGYGAGGAGHHPKH